MAGEGQILGLWTVDCMHTRQSARKGPHTSCELLLMQGEVSGQKLLYSEQGKQLLENAGPGYSRAGIENNF